MSRIRVLTTGGTIASRLDTSRGAVVSSVAGDELVASLGTRAPSGVLVEVQQFCNIGSFAMELDTAFRLAKLIDAVLADENVDGAVVTHGTDTMEESAFLADLVVRSSKPIVFTGAQRANDEPDGDGLRNLADAMRVAASPAAHELGAVIVFDSEIHAARDATKTHSSRLGTFASAEHGKLGEVDDEVVRISRRPPVREILAGKDLEPGVDLVRLALGVDGRFIRHAVATGSRGVVVEAFGRGNATPAVVEAVREASSCGVAVVACSRCPQGRVLPIYGGGGGVDLAAAGAIFCGDLSGIKARLLLAVLLGANLPPDSLRAAIKRAGR